MDTVRKIPVACIINCPACGQKHEFFWQSNNLRDGQGRYKSYRYCEKESRGLVEEEI